VLDRVVVDRVERRVQRVDQKQPKHRMRRHQVDLELDAGGNFSGVLELLELRVGLFRDVGVEQIGKAHVAGCRARFQRVALASSAARVHAEKLAGFL
jgi:hypothetical protein